MHVSMPQDFNGLEYNHSLSQPSLVAGDVLMHILTFIPHYTDRFSFSMVARSFRIAALPLFFSSVIIRQGDNTDPVLKKPTVTIFEHAGQEIKNSIR